MTSTVKVTSHNSPVRVVTRDSGIVRDDIVLTPEDGERQLYCTTTRTLEISDVPEPTQQLTFGERAVGLSFNPSGDLRVDRIKRAYANIIDELNELRRAAPVGSDIGRLASVAITEAQSAQMWAVKALTWKD